MDAKDQQAISSILKFWFEECSPEDWFRGGDQIDAAICERFGDLVKAAQAGELKAWGGTGNGVLALIILIDQFTRNVFRDNPCAFASDDVARGVAAAAIDQDLHRDFSLEQKVFLYLPFEHSEDLADQDRAVALFTELSNENYLNYAVAHRDIIQRFGRFPHRNAVLGRENTPEEDKYLAEPGAGF